MSNKKTNLSALRRHWLVRYTLAVVMFALLVAVAQGISYLIPHVNQTVPIVVGLVATAWYLGRGPGILFSVLLACTTIIFTPIPPDSTRAKAWIGYVSIFALYVFLVSVISGLRRTQRDLTEHRDLLQTTLASIGDGVIATDAAGRVNFLNPVAERLTGWVESEALGRPLSEVFRVISEETRQELPDPVTTALATGTAVGLANHSILISRTGREFPIDDSAAPISDGNGVKGVVLVFADVTERKLAERARRETEIMHRIVEAQEAERHRIARDLHDHLGQRMTALRLSIENLRDGFDADDELAEALKEIRARSREIDRDIAFLSWELRPTELDDLGLENALSSFVREWSGQYGIDAEFQTDLKGRMPLAIETNLYRIAQEGLHNILKHAEAKNVNLLLHHRGSDIVMILEDDGKGFDRELSGSTTGPGGLGLTGMQERAALFNGTLEIESGPGAGTTLLARIPLDSNGHHSPPAGVST